MILIGDEEDWPEDYSFDFGPHLNVICEILLDSQACELPISWPKVLADSSNGELLTCLESINAEKLVNCLESINDSMDAHMIFYAVAGCWVQSFGGCYCVWVEKKKLDQALQTIAWLSDALTSYWITSGKAVAAKHSYRDH